MDNDRDLDEDDGSRWSDGEQCRRAAIPQYRTRPREQNASKCGKRARETATCGNPEQREEDARSNKRHRKRGERNRLRRRSRKEEANGKRKRKRDGHVRGKEDLTSKESQAKERRKDH